MRLLHVYNNGFFFFPFYIFSYFSAASSRIRIWEMGKWPLKKSDNAASAQ